MQGTPAQAPKGMQRHLCIRAHRYCCCICGCLLPQVLTLSPGFLPVCKDLLLQGLQLGQLLVAQRCRACGRSLAPALLRCRFLLSARSRPRCRK